MDDSTALPFPDPPLSDGVVALRRWTGSDAAALARTGGDPTLRRFRDSHPKDTSEARTWLAAVEPARLNGDRLELAATIADGAVVGAVTLWAVNLKHRNAMVNHWVAAEARRRGFATRAVRLLADWCFDSLELARLQLFVEPDNTASRALAERCGFVHEGTLRSHGQGDGRRHDSLVYGLLPGELR